MAKGLKAPSAVSGASKEGEVDLTCNIFFVVSQFCSPLKEGFILVKAADMNAIHLVQSALILWRHGLLKV